MRAGARPQPRRSGCAASSSCLPRLAAARRLRRRAQLASTAPLRGRVRPRDDDPRPQLQARARTRTSALRGARDARARAAAARRSHRVDRRLASRRATTSSRTCGVPARQDRRRAARRSAPPRTAAPTPEAGAARAARRSATGRVLLCAVGQAPAQEPRAAARGARADPAPSARPVLVLPGYPTPHEAELRARAARARRSPATCASSAGCAAPTSRACTRSPPRSCSRRSTRASGCRCSRRWRAACRSPARTASSLPEVAGDAALLFDPERPGGDRRARSSGCSATAPRRERLRARRAASAPRASPGSARRELTLAAYERALAAARVGAATVLAARRSSDSRRALRGEPVARSSSRSAAPASCTRRIARGEVLGRGADAATKPLTPSSTSSTAALSVAARRRRSACRARPPRRRPGRSPRGATAAPGTARARSAVVDARSASTKPGRVDDVRRARARAIAAQHRGALGPVAEDRAAQLGQPRARASATAGTSAGARFSRDVAAGEDDDAARPALGSGGVRSPAYSPSSTVDLAAQALVAQPVARAGARSRTRAGGTRTHSALHRAADAPPARPRYSRQ